MRINVLFTRVHCEQRNFCTFGCILVLCRSIDIHELFEEVYESTNEFKQNKSENVIQQPNVRVRIQTLE